MRTLTVTPQTTPAQLRAFLTDESAGALHLVGQITGEAADAIRGLRDAPRRPRVHADDTFTMPSRGGKVLDVHYWQADGLVDQLVPADQPAVPAEPAAGDTDALMTQYHAAVLAGDGDKASALVKKFLGDVQVRHGLPAPAPLATKPATSWEDYHSALSCGDSLRAGQIYQRLRQDESRAATPDEAAELMKQFRAATDPMERGRLHVLIQQKVWAHEGK